MSRQLKALAYNIMLAGKSAIKGHASSVPSPNGNRKTRRLYARMVKRGAIDNKEGL